MEDSLPLVSIVIPTYNCARFLSTAIESALGQTYPRVEVIVVDDGSSDDTPQVAAQYKDRISYRRQRNRGAASARNAGILASSGEFVVFLDADDRLLTNMVETLMEEMHKDSECDVACSGWYITDAELRHVGRTRIEVPDGRLFEWMLRDGGYLITGGTLLRRSIIDVAGPFDPDLPNFEDWEFWVRLSYFGKFRFVQQPLVEYRQLSVSRSRAFSEFGRSTAAVAAKVQSFLEQHKEPTDLVNLVWMNRRNLKRSLLAQNCFMSYWAGDYGLAARYATSAILSSAEHAMNRGIWAVLVRSLVHRQKPTRSLPTDGQEIQHG